MLVKEGGIFHLQGARTNNLKLRVFGRDENLIFEPQQLCQDSPPRLCCQFKKGGGNDVVCGLHTDQIDGFESCGNGPSSGRNQSLLERQMALP